MAHSELLTQFCATNIDFRKVLAGQVTVQSFFTKPQYADSKHSFMHLYAQEVGKRAETSLYQDENAAAAWITMLRYNENMSNDQFKQFLDRSEVIFTGKADKLDLQGSTAAKSDLCAIMWGIEALNGIQSFDSGATRVRLLEGVAPKIVSALEAGGAVPRSSTHATCTKLVDKGLGKDIHDEALRAFTPRGMGALLVIPTSRDGNGTVAKASAKISTRIKATDYDLLLKCEKYGYNDKQIHTNVHSKVGFLNYLKHSKKYKTGMSYIFSKSTLAKNAEAEFGKGPKIYRKEHLSELKEQSATLVSLLEAGKKQGLFADFKTTWTTRIKWPPWEKKIVSADANTRKGLGDFLHQLNAATLQDTVFAKSQEANLHKVSGLLAQASKKTFGEFQNRREGNEVLVDCQTKKAVLVDKIAKNTQDDPVDRDLLEDKKIVSESNPELIQHQHDFQRQLRENQKKEPELGPVKDLENMDNLKL